MTNSEPRCTCGASTPSRPSTQLTDADLKQMSPQEIHDAYESGRLDDLLNGRPNQGETNA